MIITKEEAKQKLLDYRASKKGHFFSAQFEKADKTYRFMTCRFSVRRWKTATGVQELTGTGKQWDPSVQAIQVWDVQKRAHRSISTDRLVKLKIDGQEYTVI